MPDATTWDNVWPGLALDENGCLTLNGRAMSERDLPELLRRLAASGAEPSLEVAVDERGTTRVNGEVLTLKELSDRLRGLQGPR